MNKLFQVLLPLQTYLSEPGDITATLSAGDQYELVVTIPRVGVVGFKGKSEEDLKQDIISALRTLAPTAAPVVLEVIAEVLTDLPYSIVLIDDEVSSSMSASLSDMLSTFSSVLSSPTCVELEDISSGIYVVPEGDVMDFLKKLLGESTEQSQTAYTPRTRHYS